MEEIGFRIKAKVEFDAQQVQQDAANTIKESVDKTIKESQDMLNNTGGVNQVPPINNNIPPIPDIPDNGSGKPPTKYGRIKSFLRDDRDATDEFLEQNDLSKPFRKLAQDVEKALNDIVSSDDVQSRLTDRQKQELKQTARHAREHFEDIADETQEFVDKDIAPRLTKGYLTRQETDSRTRKVSRKEDLAIEEIDQLITDISEMYGGVLTPEQINAINQSLLGLSEDLSQGVTDSVEKFRENVKALKDEFDSFKKDKVGGAEGGGEGGDGSKGRKKGESLRSELSQILSALGIYSLANMTLEQGYLRPLTVGSQVTGRDITSFDFNSPVAMFGTSKQAETFRETQLRSLEASQEGALYGGLGGAAMGGVGLAIMAALSTNPIGWVAGAGMIAGGAIGGMSLGSNILGTQAQAENTIQNAQLEASLKTVNQLFSKVESLSSLSAQYDKELYRLRALGGNEIDLMGYTHTEQTQLQQSYIKNFGRINEDFRDVVNAARVFGVDPSELFRFGRTAQQFDKDGGRLNAGMLQTARNVTFDLYGEGSTAKIISVLEATLKINEEMLSFDKDVSQQEGFKFAMLPAMLFGKDSTYGRIDQRGQETLNQMQNLFKPREQAHDALLYQILKPKDPWEYTKMKNAGIYYEDEEGVSNLEKMFGENGLMKFLPNGYWRNLALNSMGVTNTVVNEQLASSIDKWKKGESSTIELGDDKYTFNSYKEFENELKTNEKFKETFDKMKDAGNDLASKSSSLIDTWTRTSEQIDKINMEIAQSYKKTMQDMQIDMAKLNSELLSTAKAFDKLSTVIDEGFAGMKFTAAKMGLISFEEAGAIFNPIKRDERFKDFFDVKGGGTYKENTGDILSKSYTPREWLMNEAILVAEKTSNFEGKDRGSSIEGHSGAFTNEVMNIFTEFLRLGGYSQQQIEREEKIIVNINPSLKNNLKVTADMVKSNVGSQIPYRPIY